MQLKWDTFAKKYFYIWFAIYCAFLVILTLAIIQPYFLLDENGDGNKGLLALEILVLIYSACSIFLEARDMWTLKLRYFTEKGSRFFYGLAWLNSLLIWLAFAFRLAGLQVYLLIFSIQSQKKKKN